jgi:hypothetical protein
MKTQKQQPKVKKLQPISFIFNIASGGKMIIESNILSMRFSHVFAMRQHIGIWRESENEAARALYLA